MAALELRPFHDEFVDPAGDLLARRHRRHRRVEPLLPTRFEDPARAREEVAALWERDGASGCVGLDGGRLTGFLLGTPRQAETWGPNVWVELAGQASDAPEAARDLYGSAAQRWVDEGRTRHYVIVPAGESALVTSWFKVGFGQQHAYGVREVHGAEDPIPAEIELREAGIDDVAELVRIGRLLPDHHRRAPVFSTVHADCADDLAGWRADVLDPRIGIVVAERDGSPVGAAVGAPVELSRDHAGLARPDGACILAFAATDSALRGSGVGSALTQGVFRWANEQGYGSIVTDWRVTNLLSSRFWPRRGFRETFLRLYRSIP